MNAADRARARTRARALAQTAENAAKRILEDSSYSNASDEHAAQAVMNLAEAVYVLADVLEDVDNKGVGE